MAEISDHFGVHYVTVNRALMSFEQRQERNMTA